MSVFEMNAATENAFPKALDRWAIYLRKSRADLEAEKLGEGETLARHKKILTELAARKGLYVEKIYQEIVSGAESIQDRPEIKKLIEDCYAGKYRGIIIIEVTRLSRGSQGDAQIIMDCLKYANRNNGLLVVTPTKTYDVAHNSDDEEYMEFELFMSRREYKMIKKRMDRGRKQAVVEGNYMGAYRPYGYNIIKSKTARTLIPHPDESSVVKSIFAWACQGMTPGKIARKLTNMGIPTYRGEAEWSDATIKSIITNPTYTGKVRWNDRMQVKTMVNGELVTSRPRSSHTDHYMEYEGKHKQHALVDEETFKAVSSRFYADKTKSGLKLSNPLAGIFMCKHCQKMMQYQGYKHHQGKTSPRFVHKSSQLCKVKSVMVDDVLKALAHSLRLYIEDFEVKVDNLPDVDENTITEQLEALQAQLRKTEKKLSKLFDAWEDEDITDNEFVERKAVNTQRIEAIKAQMEELEDSIPEKEEYEELVMLLSDALEALLDPEVDAESKNAFLKQIVKKIEFSRENEDEFILDVFLR